MGAAPERGAGTVVVAGEGKGARSAEIEPLGREEVERVFPNEEYLVDGVARVDLQLVVGSAAVDEEFDVVFEKNERVALGEAGLGERVFAREADVEAGVVPQDGGAGVEEGEVAVTISTKRGEAGARAQASESSMPGGSWRAVYIAKFRCACGS